MQELEGHFCLGGRAYRKKRASSTLVLSYLLSVML